MTSEANVLRGAHLHLRHWDYLTVIRGRVLVNLADLRPNSPTVGLRSSLKFSGGQLQSLTIPPGILHGFYYFEPSLHLYAVSEYWDVTDELGCRYDDPELGLTWPSDDPILSPRDAALGTFSELQARVSADPGVGQSSRKTASGRRDFEAAR